MRGMEKHGKVLPQGQEVGGIAKTGIGAQRDKVEAKIRTET